MKKISNFEVRQIIVFHDFDFGDPKYNFFILYHHILCYQSGVYYITRCLQAIIGVSRASGAWVAGGRE